MNELAPRVHNTGHWTVEACSTSQFEQHVRAICGLLLGSTEQHTPAALVNLLGTGSRRPARPTGVDRALALPGVHVHLYDKREVFERRKMGHVVATAASVDEALERARAAAALAGAFLTLAIVLGEFTIASLSAFHTFPIYLQYVNETQAYAAGAATV